MWDALGSLTQNGKNLPGGIIPSPAKSSFIF